MTAEEVLARHRNGTLTPGDGVKAIVALDERIAELERRLEDLSEIVWRPILEGD